MNVSLSIAGILCYLILLLAIKEHIERPPEQPKMATPTLVLLSLTLLLGLAYIGYVYVSLSLK